MKTNIFILTIAIAISACQTMPYQPYARDVKKKPGMNGIIALKPEHREEDRQKATTMMQSNCGANQVKVIEEGEVVIGQESTTNSNTSKNSGESSQQVGSFFGLPVMSGGKDPSESTSAKVSTTAVKEWQINYECLTKKSTVK
jgi:hypothetical protein